MPTPTVVGVGEDINALFKIITPILAVGYQLALRTAASNKLELGLIVSPNAPLDLNRNPTFVSTFVATFDLRQALMNQN